MNAFHVPVLMRAVIEGLDISPGKRYVDATVGGGGYGLEIIRRGGLLLGIDRDSDAIGMAGQKFEAQSSFGKGAQKAWKLIRGNFRDIKAIAQENGFSKVDGVLFDLGVSSHQLDTPERGFSFRSPGMPLDLRMDQSSGIPAGAYIQSMPESDLYEIFTAYGEEKFARTIAGSIVRARHIAPIRSVGDLLRVVDAAVGSRKNTIGTYARIFQALRIAVNDELSALKEGVTGALEIVKIHGRVAIISYHSLEDRIVKRAFNRPDIMAVNKRPITPGNEEIRVNSRSRSAKLRIAEKL
jgi:16S rRNA (cytosine1402-N4)-methyltransferase